MFLHPIQEKTGARKKKKSQSDNAEGGEVRNISQTVFFVTDKYPGYIKLKLLKN